MYMKDFLSGGKYSNFIRLTNHLMKKGEVSSKGIYLYS